MSRRRRNRDAETPLVETSPVAAPTPRPAAAAVPVTAPERATRPGRVMVRALRSCLVESMARFEGDVFSLAESELQRRVARGEVEPV